jgi:hypothetical protein
MEYKFKIGDRVICLEPTTNMDGQVVEKGKEYIIQGVSHCKCEPCYDIGIPKIGRSTKCYRCGVMVSTNGWLLRESRFRKHLQPNRVLKRVQL